MSILGSIIAIGAALAFAAIGVITIWAGYLTWNDEVRRGFVSRPETSPGGRTLTAVGLAIPIVGVAVLSLLGAVQTLLVGLGL